MALIGEVQGIYRKHDSAMSNAYWANILSDYRQRRLAFEIFFDGVHGRFVDGMRGTALRALADKAFQSGIDAIRRGRIASGSRTHEMGHVHGSPLAAVHVALADRKDSRVARLALGICRDAGRACKTCRREGD